MSREIKFRVWNPEIKRFVNGMQLSNLEPSVFLEPFRNFPSSWKVMQYTGRNAIDETPIYEKDIVSDLNHEATGIVTWDDEGCDYNLVDKDGNFIQAFGFENSKYDVLGNVYENPELLK